MSIMHCERMLNYYPEKVKKIREFPAMVKAKCPEMGALSDERKTVLDDAWMLTMDETRVLQWERLLGITPKTGSSLQDRREVIAARVYGGYKLNTESIKAIVSIFTQGECESYFRDSVIHVIIFPPAGDKTYQFDNIENELIRRVPAHLDIEVTRNYSTWGDVADNHETWNTIYEEYDTWDDVYWYTPPVNGGN